MDNVTKELKTNNMKLKGLVESVSPCKAVLPMLLIVTGLPNLLCACRCGPRGISA